MKQKTKVKSTVSNSQEEQTKHNQNEEKQEVVRGASGRSNSGATSHKEVRQAVAEGQQAADSQSLSHADVQSLAYRIYLGRLEKGAPGDAFSDWCAAETELKQAALCGGIALSN